MVQYTKRPHGKKGEQEKGERKETQEKGPALSFESKIDERAKHLEERMGKLQAQLAAQKKFLDEKYKELSDMEKDEFFAQLKPLINRLARVAEQIEAHKEAQKELAQTLREGYICGLGRIDEKRQIFIADDSAHTEIDVRVPELMEAGKCKFSIIGKDDGVHLALHYNKYTLEMLYHIDSQNFEVYYTREDVPVTYQGSYDNPDQLPEVFNHFREKVREDKEFERLQQEPRKKEQRVVDLNGDDLDGTKKARSGAIPRSEGIEEAQKRRKFKKQEDIVRTAERNLVEKVHEGAHDDTIRSLPESLPSHPHIDIGDDRRKLWGKQAPVVESATGEVTIHDVHVDLNIAGVPRDSIETSVDGEAQVILVSFYDNHYFIELRYNPTEKKCGVSTYFDIALKQEKVIEEDKTFDKQLSQAIDSAKELIREEVLNWQKSQLKLEERVRRLPVDVQTSRRIQEGRAQYARAMRGFHEGKIDDTQLSTVRRQLEDLLDELSVEKLVGEFEEDSGRTVTNEQNILYNSKKSLRKLSEPAEHQYLSGELQALYNLLKRIEDGELSFVHEYVMRKEDYLDQLDVLTMEKFTFTPTAELERAVRPIDKYVESLDAAELKKREAVREKKEALRKERLRQIASERARALKIEEYLKRGLLDDFDGVLSEEKAEIDELRRGTASASFDQRDRESLGRDVGRLSALRKKIQEAVEIADEEERKIEVEMLVHQYALLKAKMYDAMRILASSQSGRMSDYVSPARGKATLPYNETVAQTQDKGVVHASSKDNGELSRLIELGRKAMPNFERQIQELSAADQAEVNHLIAELKELLDAEMPSQNVIEAKMERIRSIFKRVASSRVVNDFELGDDIGNKVESERRQIPDDIGNRLLDHEELHLPHIQEEILDMKKAIRKKADSQEELAPLLEQLDLALRWIKMGKSEAEIDAGERKGRNTYKGMKYIRNELYYLLPRISNHERPLGVRHTASRESPDQVIPKNIPSLDDKLAAFGRDESMRRANAQIILSRTREEIEKGTRDPEEILEQNKEKQRRLLNRAFEKLKVHEQYKDIFEEINSVELIDTQDNPVEKKGAVLLVRKDVVAGRTEEEIDALVDRVGLELKMWLNIHKEQYGEFHIETGVTTRAKERKDGGRNEDVYIYEPDRGLFAVFDGMGGHAAGDIASRMARDECAKRMKELEGRNFSPEQLKEQIDWIFFEVNRIIIDEATKDARKKRMGTTASLVKLWEGPDGARKAIIGNVGDSRVYRYTAQGQLEQITKDHSFLDAQAGLSDEVKNREHEINDILDNYEDSEETLQDSDYQAWYFFDKRNRIMQSLGTEELDPRTYIVDLEPGDRLLISCDGIHDNLTGNQIKALLSNRSASANELSRQIVEQAYAVSKSSSGRAKEDDLTAVVVDIVTREAYADARTETPPRGRFEDIAMADTVPELPAQKPPERDKPIFQDIERKVDEIETAIVLLGFLKEAGPETFGAIDDDAVYVVDEEFEGGFEIKNGKLFVTRSKLYGGE